ncbi:Alpha/Beta hydrolase protein [Phyllosticta citribraziliensis]|uniref:Alpha/Beta hydrolase protein n=1 Tax=Phyllosticta citribraziliensis TaxID=989973 RepID=A0ABR1LVP6_9PEZI
MGPCVGLALWQVLVFVVVYLAGLSSATSQTQAPCVGADALAPSCQSRESLHYRDFFYIGGRYIKGTSGPTSGAILVDQIYVEKLTPATGVLQPKPVVFVHPGGTSGASWLNTPDNRKGFASFFLGLGYQVYLLDTQGVGRSSENDISSFPLTPGSTIEEVEKGYTAPETANLYPTAKNHNKWPGSGLRGDPIFEAFAGSIIPVTTNNVALENAVRVAGCKLLSIIGPAFVLAHSFGSFAPILWSNDCPQFLLGSINLEPANTPFQLFASLDPTKLGSFPTRPWGLVNTRLDYDPPVSDPKELQTQPVGQDTRELRRCILQVEPVHKLPKIASVPYLALTSNASVHVTWDHCVIDYLKQVGGNPEWLFLDDLGITGNGLFMHLELNNLEIAKVVHEWILKTLYGERSFSKLGQMV